MSTIGNFEGFQPVSLKQEGDDQPSETDRLSMEEGDPGKDPVPKQISKQPSVTESTLYPNPYHGANVSRKYFVTRPGTIETAMEDLKGHIAKTSGEKIQGFWLLTEIDHWNNEKERILVITDKTLLICKYDFIMLSCVQLQRIPLSAVYRICLGKFAFPGMSLDKRQGEGLRIYWGSLEQQSLLSRWNPWSTEVPYATFTEHPMRYTSEQFLEICKLSGFMSKLVPAIQNALKSSSGSGGGKGLMVLTEPILIETYMGLMSFIGNRNKLGYSLARGSIGLQSMVHVGTEKFEACVLRPHFFQGTVEMPPGIWMFHEPNWQMFNTGQVLLQPGMSRRTFFLDPAFVLYSITEEPS